MLHSLDQFLDLFAGRLAVNAALAGFAVMKLARFFGKLVTDVIEVFLDGEQVINASDRAFKYGFKYLAMSNQSGDFSVSAIEVLGGRSVPDNSVTANSQRIWVFDECKLDQAIEASRAAAIQAYPQQEEKINLTVLAFKDFLDSEQAAKLRMNIKNNEK